MNFTNQMTNLETKLENQTQKEPLNISVEELIVEKSVHGHQHIDELYFMYEPLVKEINSRYGDSRERDFLSAQISLKGVRARIYFRYFSKLKLLNLDWIYIPKSLRRNRLGSHLLRKMSELFPQAEEVHLLLAHGNLKAFLEGQQKTIDEKIHSAPTIKQLEKLGFTEIISKNFIQFPNDQRVYPEIVLAKKK